MPHLHSALHRLPRRLHSQQAPPHSQRSRLSCAGEEAHLVRSPDAEIVGNEDHLRRRRMVRLHSYTAHTSTARAPTAAAPRLRHPSPARKRSRPASACRYAPPSRKMAPCGDGDCGARSCSGAVSFLLGLLGAAAPFEAVRILLWDPSAAGCRGTGKETSAFGALRLVQARSLVDLPAIPAISHDLPTSHPFHDLRRASCRRRPSQRRCSTSSQWSSPWRGYARCPQPNSP